MNFMSSGRGFYQESSSSSPHSVPTVVPTTNENSDEQILQLGGGGGSAPTPAEKEHMFDKVVTPSDVGKLNRLVIPKQHAEKYFPLDSSSNEKGLLLNFEDRNGKPWRFRYSYWNSSQSYVMTKGWSRFVKEKKLDAGDIVSFQRGIGEIGRDRLFIDWRRRPDAPDLMNSPLPFSTFQAHQIANYSRSNWNPLFLQQPPREYSHFHHPYAYSSNTHHNTNHGYHHTVVNGNPCPPGSIFYLRSNPGAGIIRNDPFITGQTPQMVYDSVPVVQGKAAAKRLRLFGVNMDCPISSDNTNVDDENVSVMLNPVMPMTLQQYFPAAPSPGSSSSIANGLSLRPDYHHEDDKGKGTMSLDLDI